MKFPVHALAAAALALLPLPLVAQDGPGPNTYDRAGRPLTAVDQQGRRYSYTYEPDGTQNRWAGKRLVSVKRPDGTLLEFAYSPRGDRGETRIARPGQPPQVVRYPPQPADESRGKTYDHLGRWAGGTVDGQAVRYTYDADGARNTWVDDRVVRILTIGGTFIEHAYSADGFLGQTRITRPGQPPEVTEHPRPFKPTAVAAGAQSTTPKPPPPAPPKATAEKPMKPARERAGRAGFAVVPAAASAPLNLSEEPPGSTIILLVTRRTYDDFDRLETETTTLPDGTGERTVSYTYYRNGVRKTVTDPQGNVTFYTYDARNRVQTVTTHFGTASAKTTTFGYWPDGLLKEVQYPNGVVASYGYDLADRLLTLTHAKGVEVISSYEYTYDDNGNRLSQTETNGGVTEVTTYTYDALNRLKSVTYPADTVYPQGRRVEYGYDAVGNRTSERTVDPVSGEVLGSTTGTFDAVNRLQVLTNDLNPEDTATFTWDANGNQTGKTQRGVTTTSVYDLQDRLVEVQQGTAVLGRFLYDFAGRRTEKIGAEGVRLYVYDQTSLLAEYSDTGLQVAKYDYGPDRLISLERSGQRRYYLFDALRSVTNITDEAGLTQASYHLDAWGNFRIPSELNSSDAAASKNRFAFTGYLWDQETSLYYAKARFYDPEVGRFTSQDSFLGEINDPPSLHRYFYANANPTRYIDPTGHQSIGAEFCRAYGCSANTRRQVDPLYAAEEKVQKAVNTVGGAAVIVGVQVFEDTLGNAGHRTPEAQARRNAELPKPENTVEALLATGGYLAVIASPAGARALRETPVEVGPFMARRPGATAAQAESAALRGVPDGITAESSTQVPRTPSGAPQVTPLRVPQGVSPTQFEQLSQRVGTVAEARGLGGDVVVHGSRAAGTAKPTSDLDIAIRVDEATFQQQVSQRFGTPSPGSAKAKTMQHAIETGKIQAGEAGLRPLRKELEKIVGLDVDVSIVRREGPFDQSPTIPVVRPEPK
jgi:RHS repeat-associated protein